MKHTLTSHVLLRIVPIVLLMLVATGLLAFFSCRREINYVYDMQMVNDADVLWSLVNEELHEEGFKNIREIAHGKDRSGQPIWNGGADDYGSSRMFRVWHGNKIVMHSDNAFPDDVKRQSDGFSDVIYQSVHWRIYTMPTGDNTAVEIGEEQELRHALIWNIIADLFIPLGIMIPLIGFGLWAGIKKGIRPIHTLAGQIHSRNADDLADVSTQELPRDLKPLAGSINRLFSKLSNSISSERRFTDHAAHQLRTPLAGSRLLIQMLKTADTEEERTSIVADLEESNARASEMVKKLLTSARISYQSITLQPVLIYPAVARILAGLAPISQAKSIMMSLEGDESLVALADETLLSLMFQNIIENAVKYAPVEGMVSVSISEHDSYSRIIIIDNGPGIAFSERQLVFERFYRVAQKDSEGSGIGLAIVAEILRRLDGFIQLADPETHSGLKIIIDLPKA